MLWWFSHNINIGYVIDYFQYVKSSSYPVCICGAESALVDWRRDFCTVDFKSCVYRQQDNFLLCFCNSTVLLWQFHGTFMKYWYFHIDSSNNTGVGLYHKPASRLTKTSECGTMWKSGCYLKVEKPKAQANIG